MQNFTMVNSLLIPAGANHHIRTIRSLLFATITLTRIMARFSVSTLFTLETSMLRQKLLSIKKTRFIMGINPLDFEWLLEKGESFTCPEGNGAL